MLKNMHPVLFCELQPAKVLLLTRDSYMSWSTRFISLKVCVGFPILDFVSVLLIFFFNQKHGLFDVIIISFKIKIIEKPHTVLLSDLWFLSCNKKFENSVNWSSLKTDLETNILKLENRSFEYVTFSQ